VNIDRNPNFKVIADSDVQHFESILPKKGVVTDAEEILPWNSDWTKKFVGQSKLMLKPSSSEEVAAILSYCNQHKIAIVPQGGNTGLVGGSQPIFDEVILNMSNMNKIINFDESYGIITAEGGVILETMQNYLNEVGYCMPLDLGAKGSCQIGGNLSTNAGGIHFIRHNSLHANCIGLKAVLASGEILDNITTLRKDNTGYDLKHLFIGAEGTLGVITECAILCPPEPKSRQLAIVACETFEDVVEILKSAKLQLSDILQACEFMDRDSMAAVLEQHGKDEVFDKAYPFYQIIEVASNNDPEIVPEDSERLLEFIDSVSEHIHDGIVPQGETQAHQIWYLRENVADACVKYGYCLKYDVSLHSKDFYKLVEETRNVIKNSSEFTQSEREQVLTTGYGHIGDGNLHLNVSIPGYDSPAFQDKLNKVVEPFVMSFVKQAKGSVSAEHGICFQKTSFLEYSKSKPMIDYMQRIKSVFDPNGIMNPYKVLPMQ